MQLAAHKACKNTYKITINYLISALSLQDKKAYLSISSYIDDILTKVCKRLGIEIPEYTEEYDPTKHSNVSEWTLPQEYVKEMDKQFKEHQKSSAKNRNTGSTQCEPLLKGKMIKKRKKSE